LGAPNELATPIPCGTPANEPSELDDPELAATPGAPKDLEEKMKIKINKGKYNKN